jgi:hypothetical protein
MKIKTAAIALIVAAGISILLSFLNITNFTSKMMYSVRYVTTIMNIFYLAVPISLLLLGIALISNKSNTITLAQDSPASSHQENGSIPSVGDWMLIFLLMLIPLVNIILLIVWAMDKNNMARKNYAVATLIWAVIIIVLSGILFATVLSSVF